MKPSYHIPVWWVQPGERLRGLVQETQGDSPIPERFPTDCVSVPLATRVSGASVGIHFQSCLPFRGLSDPDLPSTTFLMAPHVHRHQEGRLCLLRLCP